jgi:hypothetical protein
MHSQKKRVIWKGFLVKAMDQFLAKNTVDIVEPFAGMGIHWKREDHSNSHREKGSFVAAIEAAADKSANNARFALGVYQAKPAAWVECLAKEILVPKVKETKAHFAPSVHVAQGAFTATYPAELATETTKGRDVVALIDPYEFSVAPFGDIAATFTRTRNGAQTSSVVMNLFTRTMVKKFEQKFASTDRAVTAGADALEQHCKDLAHKGFGYSEDHVATFLDDLGKTAYETYKALALAAWNAVKPDDQADRADAVGDDQQKETGKALLRSLREALAAHPNYDHADSALASNRISKIFAVHHRKRLAASTGGLHASARLVAVLDSHPFVMYWMYAVSSKAEIAAAFDTTVDELVAAAPDNLLHKTPDPYATIYFRDHDAHPNTNVKGRVYAKDDAAAAWVEVGERRRPLPPLGHRRVLAPLH